MLEEKLNYHILKCPKDIDAADVLSINKKVRQIENDFTGNIYLDMSDVEYIGSSALGALIHMWKTLDNTRVSIVIYKPSSMALKIIKDCNLHKIFKIASEPIDDKHN